MEPFNLKQNDGSLGMDQLGGHEEGLDMLSYGDFHSSTSDFEARVSLSLKYIINSVSVPSSSPTQIGRCFSSLIQIIEKHINKNLSESSVCVSLHSKHFGF